jgi:TatA/E family protein of Tat protein translocase
MHDPFILGFLSGSPGMGELLLLSAVILVLFGPRRLPEVARMIGRAMQELRRASQDFRDQVMRIDVSDVGAESSGKPVVPVAEVEVDETGDREEEPNGEGSAATRSGNGPGGASTDAMAG